MLSNELSELFTFPIDYYHDGKYGLFASCRIQPEQVRLLKSSENLCDLIEFAVELAGEDAEVEMSEMALACNDIHDLWDDEDDEHLYS